MKTQEFRDISFTSKSKAVINGKEHEIYAIDFQNEAITIVIGGDNNSKLYTVISISAVDSII